MKTNILAILVGLCSVLQSAQSLHAQKQFGEDDPQTRQRIVVNAFNEVSAKMYTSFSEKILGRLGDSAAPEIVKILSSKKSVSNKDVETALELSKIAFRTPQFIQHPANRVPTNTLALLDYLDKHAVDTGTRSKIDALRSQLQAANSQSQESVPR